jgi:hypothetical protein
MINHAQFSGVFYLASASVRERLQRWRGTGRLGDKEASNEKMAVVNFSRWPFLFALAPVAVTLERGLINIHFLA